MTNVAIVDFDKTLISKDSIVTMIKGEQLYVYPSIVLLGIALMLFRYVLPRKLQIPLRTRLKFLILTKLHVRNSDNKIIEKYSEKLKSSLNEPLVRHLLKEYRQVYIFSSSWQPFVEKFIRMWTAQESWQVYGTELDELSYFKIRWYTQKLDGLTTLNINSFDLFTDSFDDKPLMCKADNVFLVHNQVWKKL